MSVRPLYRVGTTCSRCRQLILRQRFSTNAAARSQAAQSITATPIASTAGQTADDPAHAPPRWARTPQAMRAPVRSRAPNDNDDFPVNEDPKRLDAAYRRMLGAGGDRLLTEPVKWLAVTHKSFEHGARGFNERLGFLGRRIVELQASLALLGQPRNRRVAAANAPDQWGRIPFQHDALSNVENISTVAKTRLLDKRKLARLAQDYGLAEVIRWKPSLVNDLNSSGLEFVLSQTVYAIVGAIALQKGGEVANQIVRQRILQPMGMA